MKFDVAFKEELTYYLQVYADNKEEAESKALSLITNANKAIIHTTGKQLTMLEEISEIDMEE